jgi:hypothetical protein
MSALTLRQQMDQLHKQQLQLRKQAQVWVVPMPFADQALYASQGCEVFVTMLDGTSHRCNRVRTFFQQTSQGRLPVCAQHALEHGCVYPSIIRSRM